MGVCFAVRNNLQHHFFEYIKTKKEFVFVSRIYCMYDLCIEIQLRIKIVEVLRIVLFSF